MSCATLEAGTGLPSIRGWREMANPDLSHLPRGLLALRMPASRSSAPTRPCRRLHSRGWRRPLFSSLQVPQEEGASPTPSKLNHAVSVRGQEGCADTWSSRWARNRSQGAACRAPPSPPAPLTALGSLPSLRMKSFLPWLWASLSLSHRPPSSLPLRHKSPVL